jgi:LacI family transcriptional regulator
MTMQRVCRVAILMGQDLSFCRNVIRGIRRYAMQKPHWVFRNGPPELEIVPYLREWKPHGVIANLFREEVATEVMRMRKPLVDTAYAFPELKIPTVDVDHAEVGRLAALHFLERKFVNYAFFGSASLHYSRLRENAFCDELARHGFEVSRHYGEYVHLLPSVTGWKRMDDNVLRWLRRLPKPAAVFACNDAPARNLIDMCRQLDLRIPDDIAVLGVDDDELECSLASIPLSSVAIPSERIGYEAARLLDQLMKRGATAKRSVFLPPMRVATRQSTDTMGIDDPMVLEAIQFIHQHATDNINVSVLVRHINAGRRELERRFRRILGCSVLTTIHQTCVERAKQLLHDTDLPIGVVAEQSGFSTPQRLAVVFAKIARCSPSAFRRQARVREVYRIDSASDGDAPAAT